MTYSAAFVVLLFVLAAVGLFLVATPPVHAVQPPPGGGGGCTVACLTLNPTQGPAGTSVSVTGTLFTDNAAVSDFTFGGTTPADQTCTSQTTDLYNGDFHCSFTVPDDSAGTYGVDATVGSQQGIATFTITASTSSSSTSSSSSSTSS